MSVFGTAARPATAGSPSRHVAPRRRRSSMSTQRGPASLPGAPGEPHELIKTLKVHPACSGALKVFLDSLLHDGELAASEREFLINSVAALRPSPYIASGHEPMGLAAGLSAPQLGLARTGEGAGDGALLFPLTFAASTFVPASHDAGLAGVGHEGQPAHAPGRARCAGCCSAARWPTTCSGRWAGWARCWWCSCRSRYGRTGAARRSRATAAVGGRAPGRDRRRR